jgi:hypothetical protein
MVLHADTGFMPAERRWISIAANNLREQTAGLVQVDVIYDLDWNSMQSIVSHRNGDMLIRAPEDAPYVKYEDTDKTHLLGVVAVVDLINYSMVTPKQVYLVADRLPTQDMFVHVTMHEIGHALGMIHVDDEGAVMYYMTESIHPSTCFTVTDAAEFCRINWCEVSQLNYCR